MKPQFRIAGNNRAQAVWLAVAALAGLLAAFTYGALVLLPRAEALMVQPASAISPAPAPAVIQVPVAIEPLHESTPEPAQPDLCAGAMTAAFSTARVEFRSSSTEIVPASRNVISVLAALAHACPGQIVIDGHSDNLGPEVANQQISVARAQSVADAFGDFGLEAERLSVRGFGSSQPIADNSTPLGRARNRRIEMSLRENPPANIGE